MALFPWESDKCLWPANLMSDQSDKSRRLITIEVLIEAEPQPV